MPRHLPLRAQVTPGGLSERERDAALADGIARGDRDSLEAVFKDVSGAVKTTAWRVLRDDSLAEDVVQDVFVTLWRDPHRFDAGRGSLRAYLLTMAHRRAVDMVRSEQARANREEREPEAVAADIDEEVWALTVGEKVRTALSGLADGERQAIALAYLHGLTYVEVAERLGAPEGTVKSRIRSGMKKLSVSLSEVRA
jgi:RNA polymerase sigma-70 factor, ECF subfamily